MACIRPEAQKSKHMNKKGTMIIYTSSYTLSLQSPTIIYIGIFSYFNYIFKTNIKAVLLSTETSLQSSENQKNHLINVAAFLTHFVFIN